MSAPSVFGIAGSSVLMRRMARNLAWIFSSQLSIALLGLLSLALTARTLGAAGLGYLAMIEAYTRLTSRFLHLEPWQATVRFGTEALEHHDLPRFDRLIGLSILSDLFGGLLAGGVGVLLAVYAARVMGMPEGGGALMLALSSLALIVAPRPTGMAVLRIYDRFDILAVTDTTIAVIRLALIALAWLAGANLWAFVAIFILLTMLDGLLPMVVAMQQMRARNQHPRFASPRLTLAENPGFLSLLWNSNFNVMLRQATQRLDIVLLASMLSATAVGFYQLARRLAEASLRIGRPISQVVYPELARFAARHEYQRLRRFVIRLTLCFIAFEAAVLVPLILHIGPILKLSFGESFAPASHVVTIQALAAAVYIAGMVIGPAMLAIGLERALSRVTLCTTALFFAILIPMTQHFGIAGASGTHLVTTSLWLVACGTLTLSRLRQLAEGAP